MGRDPNSNERQSIANAIQLIREADYRDLANTLDDFLQSNHFDINDLPGGSFGLTKRIVVVVQLHEEITIDPRIIPIRDIIDRCNAGIVELAGTILHEGTHLQCHDELAAWGTELAFYRALQYNQALFSLIFSGCENTSSLHQALDTAIDSAQNTREQIAKNGGRGYGNTAKGLSLAGGWRVSEMDMQKLALNPDASPYGKVPVELVHPTDPTDPAIHHLFKIGDAIWEYRKREGRFPNPPNPAMREAIHRSGIYYFRGEELNGAGAIIDQWGQPYIYKIEGKIFPRDFDLYSIGPNGKDEEGKGDDIVYIPRRK